MFGLEYGTAIANTFLRLCQMVAAIVVLAYYATPLRRAAEEHKYTDGKFVYATVVGSASLATALALLVIPLISQARSISAIFVWEILLVVLWIALFITFRAFFTENPEMDNGIEKMKIAVWFDVTCAILWVMTASSSSYVFFTGVFKKNFITMGRSRKTTAEKGPGPSRTRAR